MKKSNNYWISIKDIIQLKWDITDEEFQLSSGSLNELIKLISSKSTLSESQARDFINNISITAKDKKIH